MSHPSKTSSPLHIACRGQNWSTWCRANRARVCWPRTLSDCRLPTSRCDARGVKYLMDRISAAALKPFARKYIWWKTPDEAVATPERIIAQVMDIGDFFDMQELAVLVGDDELREVIAHAQAGWFRPRSWAYWHYRLELCEVDQVPALPVRRFE